MNKDSLTSTLKKLSKEKQIDFNMLLMIFFMGDFLKKIENSLYKEYFIFKGGFILSSIFGMTSRTTTDIDIELTKYTLEKKLLKKAIEEIIQIKIKSNITYEIVDITDIRVDNIYGGIHVKLIGHYENIRQHLSLDFATGDPITPSAIEYSYQPLLQISPSILNLIT